MSSVTLKGEDTFLLTSSEPVPGEGGGIQYLLWYFYKAKTKKSVFLWTDQNNFDHFNKSKFIRFVFSFLQLFFDVKERYLQIFLKISRTGPNKRFFGIKLLKIYLISRNVPVFENLKKCYIYYCTVWLTSIHIHSK